MGKFKRNAADGADSKPKNEKKVSFDTKSQNFKKKPLKAKNKFAAKNQLSNSVKKMTGPELVGQSYMKKPKDAKPNTNNFNKGKMKRKFNATGDDSPNKKARTTHGKQYSGQSTNQKSKFSKKFIGAKNDSNNEKKIMFMKKKDRKQLRRQGKLNKNAGAFERATRLKMHWEVLRKEDCKEPKKTQLLADCMVLLKDHTKEIIFAHDTVRVVECIFGCASEEQRSCIFGELKDSIIELAKSKYGKFFLIKVLRCGSKDQKNYIISQFYTKVLALMAHTEAASVVEVAFNECASAVQRAELVQEFYGASFRFFKSSGSVSLSQLLEKDPDQIVPIVKNMKETLSKILQKNVIKHSIVHHVLREFLVHADQESRAEIIELCRPLVVEMLHTKDGSRAAMHCLWYGNVKDRKSIVKSFKTHVVKIAQEEHGHMVLLALFDCVDDTVLIEKHIISELLTGCIEVSKNLYGRKVLLYLLGPRNSLCFPPDVIKILQKGDNNPYSKKDTKIRYEELRKCVIGPIVSLIANYTQEHYADNSFCWFLYAVLKVTKGHNVEAFKAIAQLAAVEYSASTKNNHIIECSGSHFILKKLLADDKDSEADGDGVSFTEVLIEEATKDILRSWTLCNRGCFILISILETGIPFVVEKVKEAMSGFHNKISKKQFIGAQVLLKKLKEC